MEATSGPSGAGNSPSRILTKRSFEILGFRDSFQSRGVVSSNLYVDDWLTGADSDEEACDLFIKGNSVLGEAGMSLAKCSSSSEPVTRIITP
jgi:hypothetical protein